MGRQGQRKQPQGRGEGRQGRSKRRGRAHGPVNAWGEAPLLGGAPLAGGGGRAPGGAVEPAKPPGAPNPNGPGGGNQATKETRDKHHSLVRAHEAVVAAMGPDSEEAKAWGEKVAELANTVPQS